MKDLKKLANECMAELDAIGIQYGNVISWEVNTRAKNRWGQCRYIGGSRYSINITNRLLDDNLPDEAAKQTIIHELLHSVNGCMNHGPNWKRVADKVNRACGKLHRNFNNLCAICHLQFRGMGVYYNQKLKLIDKKGIVCYNSKREARNRLALVCVLSGQTGLYRFKSLKIRQIFSL